MIFWEPVIWNNFATTPITFSILVHHDFYLISIFISLFIVSCGFFGFFLNTTSIIHLLIYSEIILIGFNLLFLFLSLILNDISFQIFSIVILCLSALDSCIGLTLIYRLSILYKEIDLHLLLKLTD
jgi:NADH:ubiquinone oxidoreductase subunit K